MATLQWTRDDVDFYDGETDFRTTGSGEYDVPDEKADAYLDHRSDGWEESEYGDDESEGEDSEDEFDPSDHNLDELEDALEGVDASADELHDRESDGRDREGAHEIIDAVAGE